MSPDTIAYFRPAIAAPLHDLLERFTAEQPDEWELTLNGQLAAGYYQLTLITRDGSLDTSTLMMDLTEWPTMKQVPTGPWDLDHTQYTMKAVTFACAVNGDPRGLVWANVPSPDELKRARITANWGIWVEAPGAVIITLTVPPNERYRLSWEDVEEIVLAPDDRVPMPLPIPANRPPLFARAGQFEQLAASPTPLQRAILDNLRFRFERGDDNCYDYRTVMAILLGRLTGDRAAIDLAIERTLALCTKSRWGYHDEPWIMGWNNDRDTGLNMYQTAMVLDYLDEYLTPVQRATIRERLAHFAQLAFIFTVSLRTYWYYRTAEAHGQGFWFGFAAAAMVLRGHHPHAETWLAWIHGNFRMALESLPQDGISEWYVFNVQWHILEAMLFEHATGRQLFAGCPFLDGFARNVRHMVPDQAGEPTLPTLLFFLAARSRRRRPQADALLTSRLNGVWDAAAAGRPVDFDPATTSLDPLALLACDPDLAPSTPTRPALAMWVQQGQVVCRDHSRRTAMHFRCGTPLSARGHLGQSWINQSWYHSQHAGSFQLEHDGVRLIAAAIGGYRQRADQTNILTIDGGGNPTDARWLGYDIPLRDLPFIEQVTTEDDITEILANLAPAYTPECQVLAAFRRVLFHHPTGLILLHDHVQTSAPHRFAWHLHTADGGRWRRQSPNVWQTNRQNQPLTVTVLRSEVDDLAVAPASRAFQPRWVPAYPTGLNMYKTAEWQTQLRPKQVTVPFHHQLRLSVPGKARSWNLVTALCCATSLAQTPLRELLARADSGR